MRKQNGKKILSLINFELIDLMIKDISYAEGTTESLIAEDILLGNRAALLPRNSNMSYIVMTHYLTDDAVTAMYRSVIQQAAAKDFPNYEGVGEYQVIRQIHSILCRTAEGPNEDTPKGQLERLAKLMRYLIDELDHKAKQLDDCDMAKLRIVTDIRFGLELAYELETEPVYSKYFNFLSCILSSWEYIKRSQTTYRFVTALLQVAHIPNTPEERVSAVRCLSDAFPPSETSDN